MGLADPVTREEVVEGFLTVLLLHGLEKIPAEYRRATVAEAMKRLGDQKLGFLWFWLNLAWIKVKGQGANSGWQRACPDGRPRVNSQTGRDWAWQIEVARLLPQFTQFLVLKARQLGWTYLLANFVVWCAISSPEQDIAVIANKLQSSKRIMRRALQVYKRLPAWLKSEVVLTNDAISNFEFSNGSRVEPYSGASGAARSESASRVIVDEIGEIDNLADFYADVEAISDDGGQLVMAGTAKDNGLEEFVTVAAEGKEVEACVIPLPDGGTHTLPAMYGENDMTFLFLPDYVHPTRTDEWYEKKAKAYKGNLRNFQREHPRNWREAFVAQGSGYFDAIRLKESRDAAFKQFEERDRRGTLLQSYSDPTDITFVDDPYGYVVIHASEKEFAARLASKRPFVIGADCAGDRIGGGGDAHAASGLHIGRVPEPDDDPDNLGFEVVPHAQLVTIHGRFDSDEYATQLVRLGYLLGTAVIAIEQNGVGGTVLKTARRLRYPALYMRRVKPSNLTQRVSHEYGWWSDNTTKNIAYGECERCLRNGWTDIRDFDTTLEMGNVLMLGRGSIGARDPKHDDRPDGLAIAHAMIPYARGFAGAVAPNAVHRPEWGSLEWLNARIDAQIAEREGRNRRLGSENRGILAG